MVTVVSWGTARVALAGVLVSLAPAACTNAIDPCAPVELVGRGAEQTAKGFPLIHEGAPLAAISAKTTEGYESLVIYTGCHSARPCGLVGQWLSLTGGSQVTVTGDGNWVAAIDRESGKWYAWHLPPADVDGSRRRLTLWPGRPEGIEPHRIIASLRHQNRLLVREAGRWGDSGELHILTLNPDRPEVTVDDFDQSELTSRMTVLGIGSNFVVFGYTGRYSHDVVYLGIIGRPGEGGELIRLKPRFPSLERVFVSPDDRKVAITSTARGETSTAIFAVPSGELIDSFTGMPISFSNAGEELPGLSAFSPNGYYLAYRTSEGDLAQRDVESSVSCLAHLGKHQRAGYAASGLLFADFIEGGHGRNLGVSRIVSVDLRHNAEDSSVETRRLADPEETEVGFRLAGAPLEEAVSSSGESLPWALGAHDGRYFLVQSNGEPHELPHDGTTTALEVLRRESSSLHLLRSSVRPDPGASERIVAVHSVTPGFDLDDEQLVFEEIQHELWIPPPPPTPPVASAQGLAERSALGVTAATRAPRDEPGDALEPSPHVAFPYDEEAEGDLLCISLGVLGGWGYRCRPAHQPEFFEGSDRPGSELWKNPKPGPLEQEGFNEELPNPTPDPMP